MVESSPTCTCYLPRNLSYEDEEYHAKYYYPLNYRGAGKAKAKPAKLAKNTKARVCQAGSVSSQTPQLYSRAMETSTDRCKVCGCEPGQELSSGQNNSSATLSDCDTVFSEDYTDMTDIDFRPHSQGEAASDQDADSTYTSDRSSVSTLENGEEDCEQPQNEANGGESLENDIDSSSQSVKKPEIKLTMNTPPLGRKMEDSVFDSAAALCDSDDEEFNYLVTQPVRRATSLKTYKTPPGTPGRKKAVRFADALGLDLESVRHILNLEDPPTVPTSALRDLKLTGSDSDDKRNAFQAGGHSAGGAKYLYACFQQPGIDARFLDRVRSQKVALENALVDDREMTVSGTVRVANVAFHKSVTIRYTVNNWLTFTDVTASYVLNSNDGPTDRFSFTIAVPHYFAPGSRLELCLMYSAGTQTFWDNNNGSNYVIECYARNGSTSFNDSDNSWMHFI